MTRFVILAVPRTGSNLLCTLLNSHPQVLCHHEVFNPQGVFTALDYRGNGLALQSLQQRDDDPIGFLGRVWHTGADGSCVGFKWTRGQNVEVLKNVVSDAGVKKIVLRRRNRIKTFVSEKIAQSTDQWEVYSPQELTLPRPRIHVDIQELLQHIEVNQHFYDELLAELAGLGQPGLEVDYETLLEGNAPVGMLEFLGVSPDVSLTAASVKQNSTDLREMIANFTELASTLPNDRMRSELHDLGM
jgi:LPS sulfotransferase NodH